ERPAPDPCARGAELLELQIVEEVDAQGVQRENVDRKPEAFGATRRRVAVAVAAEGGDTALRDEAHGRRVEPRLEVGCRPGPELGQAPVVAGAHVQDVAGLNREALLPLRGLELVREDVLSWLDPPHAAETRDVEEDASPDQAVLERVDRSAIGAVVER